MFGKLPWITEENIWRGLPKTSRIPTGGWRGLGAVPSHSYPAPATLPDGYWQGLGACASTYHAASQGAKATYSGFGAAAAGEPSVAALRLQASQLRTAGQPAQAAALEAQANELEKKQQASATAEAWGGALTAIINAGAQSYSAQQVYNINRDIIRAGGQPIGTPPPGAYTPARQTPPPSGAPATTMITIGLLGLAGVAAFMVLG